MSSNGFLPSYEDHPSVTSRRPLHSESESDLPLPTDYKEPRYTSLKKHQKPAVPKSSRRPLAILAFIFLGSCFIVLIIYKNSPKLDEDEWQYIKLPREIDDAKNLGRVLSRYKDKYFYEVFGGYLITYIFLQSFAIPGSIFLSLLAGYMFHFLLALLMVAFCSAVGATICYNLSYLVGRRLVRTYWPERVASWSKTVHAQRDNLINYILFLRITPFIPNWFINITSPVLDVPLSPFFWGTFFGVMPPSFFAIQLGTTLYKITSTSDALSLTSLLWIGVMAILSLLPVLYKNRLARRFEQ